MKVKLELTIYESDLTEETRKKIRDLRNSGIEIEPVIKFVEESVKDDSKPRKSKLLCETMPTDFMKTEHIPCCTILY